VSVADAIRSLVTPTPPGDCFSSGVCSDGNLYGIQEGINYSFPCRWVIGWALGGVGWANTCAHA